MRCVKCGKNIPSVKCDVCGFNHSRGYVLFLTQPAQADIQVQRRTVTSGVSELKVDIATQYSRGKAYFQAEDYDQAENWLMTPAMKGNKDAQRLLGYLYEVSDSHRDPDKAVFWYEKAASRGDLKAAGDLIRLYQATGAARDKLRYWEEKKQQMEQDALCAEFVARRKPPASRYCTVRDGVLVQYTGTEESPVLPDGITEIGEDAFRGNEYVKSIAVPEGVEKIGACAFSECPELRSVTLPQSLREIELFAFADSPIEAITLPSGLTSLGEEGAFVGTDIRTITVPGRVRTIPNQTFSGCYHLKEVVLEEGITTIEDEAFYHCGNLETVHIPDSVVRISDGSKYGHAAFHKCHKLAKVIASDAWKHEHRDVLDKMLPISPEKLRWCTEAAMQGSLEDMYRLVHWYQTSSVDAHQTRKWKNKAELVKQDNSTFPLGNRYFWCPKEKDRAAGFDQHMELAKQGDAYAQLWIGDCYFFGRGIPENKEEAAKWYLKAAEQGYAEAQYWLGYCYENGFGVEENPYRAGYWLEKALHWIRRAAERGYSKEQTMLGECYRWGYGVPCSPATAVSWFRKAAQQEYADAQYWMGLCYSSGCGVEKNISEANKWFSKAARNGHIAAHTKY